MAVAKWTWDATNPSSSQTGSIYALSGATADEVKRSYQTLVEKGAVSNFSYKVWNDMCLKLKDLSTEWAIENELSSVWVNSPYRSDYPDEATFKKSDGGIIKASAMNQIAKCFPDIVEKPFNENFKKGDPCKAEYFLLFAESLNSWCVLTPNGFGILLNIISSIKCSSFLGEIIAIKIDKAEMEFLTAQAQIQALSILELRFITQYLHDGMIKVNEGTPTVISPKRKYLEFESTCFALDKIFAILEPEKLIFQLSEKSSANVGNSISVKVKSAIQHIAGATLFAGNTLQVRATWNIIHLATAILRTGKPYEVTTSYRYRHRASAQVSIVNPDAIQAAGKYQYTGRAFVEFQDGTGLEAEDGIIMFSDNIDNGDVIGSAFSHTGEIGIKSPYTDINSAPGTEMEINEDVDIAGGIDTISEGIGNLEVNEEILVSGNQEIADTKMLQPLETDGYFEIVDGEIEADFANNKELEAEGKVVISGIEIDLTSQFPTQAEHTGTINLENDISLEESNIKPLSGEMVTTVNSKAELLRRKTIGQNANVISDISSEAEISTSRNREVESDVILSSVQSAILDMVYAKGNVISGDVIAEIISMAEATFIKQKGIESDIQAQFYADAEIEQNPAEGVNGEQIASTSSEATIALARVQLALEKIYDDRLEIELDEMSEEEIERTLVFE